MKFDPFAGEPKGPPARAAYLEVREAKNGEWWWRLRGANHEVVCPGETSPTRTGAKRGAERACALMRCVKKVTLVWLRFGETARSYLPTERTWKDIAKDQLANGPPALPQKPPKKRRRRGSVKVDGYEMGTALVARKRRRKQ